MLSTNDGLYSYFSFYIDYCESENPWLVSRLKAKCLWKFPFLWNNKKNYNVLQCTMTFTEQTVDMISRFENDCMFSIVHLQQVYWTFEILTLLWWLIHRISSHQAEQSGFMNACILSQCICNDLNDTWAYIDAYCCIEKTCSICTCKHYVILCRTIFVFFEYVFRHVWVCILIWLYNQTDFFSSAWMYIWHIQNLYKTLTVWWIVQTGFSLQADLQTTAVWA